MPTNANVLKEELRRRNLEMLGAFVPVDFSNPDAHATGAEIAVRIAKLLAAVGKAPLIVLADENGKNPIRTQNAGRVRSEQDLSDEQWALFAAGVEHVARSVCEATGLWCVFHHHCSGFVETPAEIEKLLALTGPELVGLCFDTGHYALGEGRLSRAFANTPAASGIFTSKITNRISPGRLAKMNGIISHRSSACGL